MQGVKEMFTYWLEWLHKGQAFLILTIMDNRTMYCGLLRTICLRVQLCGPTKTTWKTWLLLLHLLGLPHHLDYLYLFFKVPGFGPHSRHMLCC